MIKINYSHKNVKGYSNVNLNDYFNNARIYSFYTSRNDISEYVRVQDKILHIWKLGDKGTNYHVRTAPFW